MALAGHLPQSLTRVRQMQQSRQVATSRQVAKSATSDPSTISCNWHWLVLADMEAGSISYLAGARAKLEPTLPFVRQAQATGATSLHQLAPALTTRGIPTPSGSGAWDPASVRRVLSLCRRCVTRLA